MLRSSGRKSSASPRPSAHLVLALSVGCNLRCRIARHTNLALPRVTRAEELADENTLPMRLFVRSSRAMTSAAPSSAPTAAVARRARFFNSTTSSPGHVVGKTRRTIFACSAPLTTDCWPNKNLGLCTSRSVHEIGVCTPLPSDMGRGRLARSTIGVTLDSRLAGCNGVRDFPDWTGSGPAIVSGEFGTRWMDVCARWRPFGLVIARVDSTTTSQCFAGAFRIAAREFESVLAALAEDPRATCAFSCAEPCASRESRVASRQSRTARRVAGSQRRDRCARRLCRSPGATNGAAR